MTASLLKRVGALTLEVRALRRAAVALEKKTEGQSQGELRDEMSALRQRAVVALWERGMVGGALYDVVGLSATRVHRIINGEKLRRDRVIASEARVVARNKRAAEGLGPRTDVVELDLSMRAMNVLENASVETVEQLTQMTPQDLLRTKYCGRRSLKEIQQALADHGLALKPTDAAAP